MSDSYVSVDCIWDGDDGRVYVDDEPFTGRTCELHDNGELAGITSYVDGIEDGIQQVFYPSGKLEIEGMKKMDWKVGKWREWYENGQIRAETTYGSGVIEPLNRRTWKEDGTESTMS